LRRITGFCKETSDLLDASQRKYLERINIAASRLGHLAGELILHSGMQPSAEITSMEDLDLISLLGNVLVEITPLVEEKKILLEQDFPPEPLHIHSSAAILESVFSDLLKNAIESAGDEGKVGLRVKLERAEGKQDYILHKSPIQVRDRCARAGAVVFPALAEKARYRQQRGGKFAEIKMRIESLNGKIWVDLNLEKALPSPAASDNRRNNNRGT
jgi:signal transduction histidine kinase